MSTSEQSQTHDDALIPPESSQWSSYRNGGPLPPPIMSEIREEWYELCEKLGRDPREWQGFRPDRLSVDGDTNRLEDATRLAKDRARREKQLNTAVAWLQMVIRHNPEAILDALRYESYVVNRRNGR